jgi:hypothetical protein
VVDQRGDSLVLEELESPITGSLVKVCSTAATRGAERRDGEVAEVHRGSVEATM